MRQGMNRHWQLVGVLIGTVMLSGCQWTPHQLALNPQANLAESSVGEGVDLYFRFVDERDDTTIGHRGVATVGAKISSENLPTLVETQLREGLKKKHYQLSDSEPSATAAATFRLVAFKYYVESGFFSGGQNVSAALAVDARRNNRSYNHVYRYSNEDRIMVVPGGNELDAQMNRALDQILNQALADKDLDNFLAGK